MDTGVFDDDRYWDVFVEFAKIDPEETLIRITATNRGPETAVIASAAPALVPQHLVRSTPALPRPELAAVHHGRCAAIAARHDLLGQRTLYCEGAGELLFTDNETNRFRLSGEPNVSEFQKDGINDHVVNGRQGAVNPARKGTKSAFHSRATVAPGASATLRLRLSAREPGALPDPFAGFDAAFADRKREHDEFYRALIPASLSPDAASVVRQGYAGLLWTKQAYVYDVERWLNERGVRRDTSDGGRNEHWFHLYSADVISMPDKWEYPWFAAWDLGVPLRRARVRGSRLRARAAVADAGGALPAPERPAPRLRMELRRRQPAGARVGGAVQLSPQPRQPRRRGAAVPEAHLQHAGHQLHLVVEPQGPQRPQPVRGRVPRPRQHRRVRPQLAAADGRLPGTGRRDGLDGVLRPEHARHGAGAGAGRSHLRGLRDQVLRARRVDRLRDQPARRAGLALGSGGRVLLRRAARAGTVHDPAQGALDRRPAAALRGVGLQRRGGREAAALHRTGAVVQREPARAAREPESAADGPASRAAT